MSTRIATNPKLIAAAIVATMAALPAVALAGPSPTLAAGTAAATVDRQTALKHSAAFPTARGTAQYQSQQGHRELQVEATHLRALAGTRIVITAGGVRIGEAKVSKGGIAELTRNTELGQNVPSLTRGATVTVSTGTNRLIVSGRL